MAVFESVVRAIEKILIPKLDQIANEQKSLRELMEEKFKAVDLRFKYLDEKLDIRFRALEDKLDLDKRLTALEKAKEPPEGKVN
jgi:restriction endonuclease S subunit